VAVMEIVFAVPGMGLALVQAVAYRDYPTVQAIILILALVFLAVNLLVDLLYGWLDPRIRHA
jgi:peptide/nickel transport system permease protein